MPSARRATFFTAPLSLLLHHFYPRPPRGGRHRLFVDESHFYKFLSTPSARRATSLSFASSNVSFDFYPHPLRGGRQIVPNSEQSFITFLSTPSARRATSGFLSRNPGSSLFLSTPSARRATSPYDRVQHGLPISIHALREEGDGQHQQQPYSPCHFYPRPP